MLQKLQKLQMLQMLQKLQMLQTEYEGATGMVVTMMKCFAWVALKKNNKVIKKKAHNLALVPSLR
jgi:ribosomal protein L21E